MKSTVRILLLIIICTFNAVTMAKCQQQTQVTDSWEKLPHGIELAITLKGSFLAADVKSTSSATLKIVGEGHHLVRFFYIDLNHAKVPLTDKSDVSDISASKVSGSALIPKTGKTPLHLQIELNSDELVAIKTYPVLCRFTVLDASTRQYFTLESTPKMLSSGP